MPSRAFRRGWGGRTSGHHAPPRTHLDPAHAREQAVVRRVCSRYAGQRVGLQHGLDQVEEDRVALRDRSPRGAAAAAHVPHRVRGDARLREGRAAVPVK